MTSFMVSEMGLEPTQISPYAPETYVSTIPPLRRVNFYLIFTVHFLFDFFEEFISN